MAKQKENNNSEKSPANQQGAADQSKPAAGNETPAAGKGVDELAVLKEQIAEMQKAQVEQKAASEQLQKDLEMQVATNKELSSQLSTFVTESDEKNERIQAAIQAHEESNSPATTVVKLKASQVNAPQMLARMSNIWSRTAPETNQPPKTIVTKTFEITTRPRGEAKPLPVVQVTNCLSASDGLTTLFKAYAANANDYSYTVKQIAKKTHKLEKQAAG